MGDQAFVTLATNDTYCLGALVLAHSLRKVGTSKKIVVMIGPDVSMALRNQMAQVFDEILVVDVLDSRDSVNLPLLACPNAMGSSRNYVMPKGQGALWKPSISEPSLETYESLLAFALTRGSFDGMLLMTHLGLGGDQGLLNLYFKDWAHVDISKHLPFLYNVVSMAFYSYLPAFKEFGDKVKIVHFIGETKPWQCNYDAKTGQAVSGLSGHESKFLTLWWHLFLESVWSNLNPTLISVPPKTSQHLKEVCSEQARNPDEVTHPDEAETPCRTDAPIEKQTFSFEETGVIEECEDENIDRLGLGTHLELQDVPFFPEIGTPVYIGFDVPVNNVQTGSHEQHFAEVVHQHVPPPPSNVEAPQDLPHGNQNVPEGLPEEEAKNEQHSPEASTQSGPPEPHSLDRPPDIDTTRQSTASHDVPSPEIPQASNGEPQGVSQNTSHHHSSQPLLPQAPDDKAPAEGDYNNNAPEEVVSALQSEAETNADVTHEPAQGEVPATSISVTNGETGWAGRLAAMDLTRIPSEASLTDEERYAAWEQGRMDYTGRDSFHAIQSQLEKTLAGPAPPPKHEPVGPPAGAPPSHVSAAQGAGEPPLPAKKAQKPVAAKQAKKGEKPKPR